MKAAATNSCLMADIFHTEFGFSKILHRSLRNEQALAVCGAQFTAYIY
jgi:hypothetical protein